MRELCYNENMIKVHNISSLYSSLYSAVEFVKDHENENIELVVPDKLSLFMEKFLFEHLNISASFNIKVSTFNRFAKKCCDIPKEKQISKVGSVILIHKILNENINKFSVFKSKAYSFSYAENILRTLGQLKASKISFEEMQKFDSSDEGLKNKIQDLASIYELYEQDKAGLLDASDIFLMSTFEVAKGRENNKIIFVGFDDFTAIEYGIIEQLAKVCEINVFNYFSNSNNQHIFNREVVDQLKNIAYINELDFKVENKEAALTGLKSFLNKNLFGLNRKDYLLDDENLEIYSGRNFEDQIEYVARMIRKEILDGGAYKDYGVAVFGLEGNENKIQEIFSKYEINFYIDNELSFNKSVLYKFLCSLFKYNLESYNACHLIDVVSSPFFDLDTKQKRMLIDKILKLNFKGKVKENFIIEGLEDDCEKLKDFLKSFEFENLHDIKTVIEKIKLAFEKNNIENIINDLIENSKNSQNKILLKKSFEIVFDLFDEMLRFDQCTDVESFFDVFMHVASVVKINNLPQTIDAVKVVDANNTMEIFENLFLVDCNADNAPNLKFDCGIILDNEIEHLNFSHKLSPTISHINKLAKLRLFNSSLLFEKSLTVTYSKNPSDLVKELLNKILINVCGYQVNLVPFTQQKFSDYQAMSEWDYIETICKFDKNNKKINEKTLKNKNFSQISDKNLKIFKDFNNISASHLEKYFKCPFNSFLDSVLKIKPRIKTDIQSFDIGNVLHDLLFKYYMLDKKVDDLYDFCKTEIFKFFERDDRLKVNIKSPIILSLIDEAVRVVQGVDYIDKNSSFVPMKNMFEFAFYGDKSLPLRNVNIVGKVDRVDVFGDIFRVVDYKSGKANATLKELYYGNKLQLFLYSCAMEKFLNKKMAGGFYLPLHNEYTNQEGNAYSLNGFFLNEDFVVRAMDNRLNPNEKSDIVNIRTNKEGIARKTIAHKELESNELDNLKSYSKVVSEKAVEEIKSGFIEPSPISISDHCDVCPYVHICLKQSRGVNVRADKTVNLESFKEENDG